VSRGKSKIHGHFAGGFLLILEAARLLCGASDQRAMKPLEMALEEIATQTKGRR
jgi:hypothetical protein